MKKIKILCDPLTAAMAFIWSFCMISFGGFHYYGAYIYEKNGVDTLSDHFIVGFVWLVYGITLVTIIKCIPIWLLYPYTLPYNLKASL